MFGKKSRSSNDRRPAEPVEVATGRVPDERRIAAWIGRSMVIKGSLTSSEDLTIAGNVEGDVTVREHSLIIGPEARIRGDIVARAVAVHGVVTGTITASDKVVVGETGTVEGEIAAPRLAVADGGMLQGRIGVGGSAPTG